MQRKRSPVCLNKMYLYGELLPPLTRSPFLKRTALSNNSTRSVTEGVLLPVICYLKAPS